MQRAGKMPDKADVKFPAFMCADEVDEILFTEDDLKKRVLELGAEVRVFVFRRRFDGFPRGDRSYVCNAIVL